MASQSPGFRVLFLDIDGVLVTTRSDLAFGGVPRSVNFEQLRHRFDAVGVALLQGLCRKGGIRVVLSSAWRINADLKKLGKVLGLPIVDRTPSTAGPRGQDIQAWLAQNPGVHSYAIIDDSSDMLDEQLDRFVRIDPHDGITYSAFIRLCRLFDLKPYDCSERSNGEVRYVKTKFPLQFVD